MNSLKRIYSAEVNPHFRKRDVHILILTDTAVENEVSCRYDILQQAISLIALRKFIRAVYLCVAIWTPNDRTSIIPHENARTDEEESNDRAETYEQNCAQLKNSNELVMLNAFYDN